MTTDRSPSEVIAALEVALEAGPTPGLWKSKQHGNIPGVICGGTVRHYVNGSGQDQLFMVCSVQEDNGGDDAQRANVALIVACSPLAIRTLLDAHASALRDAEVLEALLARYIEQDIQTGNVENNLFRSARAAMGANTKGAAE